MESEKMSINWYKKANIYEEIKRYGPSNEREADISLAIEEMKKIYPNESDEKIQEWARDSYMREHYRKDAFHQNYGWSVPTQEAVQKIKEFVGNGSIIEVGGGLGLWGKLLRDEGVNIVSTNRSYNKFNKKDKKHIDIEKKRFIDIEELDHLKAIEKYGDFEILLMSWPPYDDPMAYETLKNFRGNKVVFIGESGGGCTGCGKFFTLLYNEWERIQSIGIPQWTGLHDDITFYVRK